MATENDYISNGNNADNISIIKQGAVFLYTAEETVTTPPTSTKWTPGDKKPLGYFTEDGIVLHPESGDDTEIKAHNGDIVYSSNSGGYWTIQIVGMECKKELAEAYFGTKPGADGALDIADASTPQDFHIVVAGLDHKDRPIILYAERVKVSERGDISMIYTDVAKLDVTFKTLAGKDSKQLHLYGFVRDTSIAEE